jgi:hypothetical protein
MAISSGQITVGLTPTLIDGTFNSNFRLIIQNLDNTDTVWIGNATVSPTNGLALLGQERLELELNPLEQLYAISTKTGHVITYLKQV